MFFETPLSGGGPGSQRRRRLPPIVSVALVVGIAALVIGIGFGYRLGQTAVPTAPAPSAPTPVATPAPPTSTPESDLNPDSVSYRLQKTYKAMKPGAWAVCGLGTAVDCRPVLPSLSVTPAVSYTDTFTDIEWAGLAPATIGAGHLALAAILGEGSVNGSLVLLDDTAGRTRNSALVPIDPGHLGVYYFDLGPLPAGRYAIVIGVIPKVSLEASPPPLESYLAGFVVTSGS